MVHSAAQNLILTAAHCLSAGVPVTFVPAFDDKAAPDGVWTSARAVDQPAAAQRGISAQVHAGTGVAAQRRCPWITGSTVVGVIGGSDGGGCQDNVSNSPPFDAATAALPARAEAGGPGDDAPSALDSDC